jgi:hypothetical protein
MISSAKVMVFKATFNNSSSISWRAVFLLEGTPIFREKHLPFASYRQEFSHNVITYVKYMLMVTANIKLKSTLL